MAAKQTNWVAGDRERRQHISQEVQQLRQMSETLRTTAMRSYVRRSGAVRQDIKRPDTPVKPTSVAA